MHTEIVFTHGPLIVPLLRLESRDVGACVEFQGIVRELEQGRALAGLEYEAHEPMARRHLERIFSELSVAHPIAAVLDPGDVGVAHEFAGNREIRHLVRVKADDPRARRVQCDEVGAHSNEPNLPRSPHDGTVALHGEHSIDNG